MNSQKGFSQNKWLLVIDTGTVHVWKPDIFANCEQIIEENLTQTQSKPPPPQKEN